MRKDQLLALKAEGESPKLDWKVQVSLSSERDKAEFSKDVSAMANTKSGTGHVLYGVDKTGKIVGIDPRTFQLDQMQQIISSRCRPYVEFFGELVDVDQAKVGVLSIPESTNKPHVVIDRQTQRAEVYIRRGATTEKADADEIIGMYEETRYKEAAEQKVNAVLDEEHKGLVTCREDEGWLGVIVCPFILSDSLIPAIKDWTNFTREEASRQELIPFGAYNHGLFGQGFLSEGSTPLGKKLWFVKTRHNGVIHYGRRITYPNNTVSRDLILHGLTGVFKYAQRVLERAGYQGKLKILVSLSNVGNKRLVSEKIYIFEDRYYREGENLAIEQDILLSDLTTDFDLVIRRIINKLCRYFHVEVYDQ